MGRFNFTQFDQVPSMVFIDFTAQQRIKAVLPTLAWLTVLSGLLQVIALRRLGQWPMLE